jgi:hypothetical protein
MAQIKIALLFSQKHPTKYCIIEYIILLRLTFRSILDMHSKKKKGKAVPLHAMETLGGEEV